MANQYETMTDVSKINREEIEDYIHQWFDRAKAPGLGAAIVSSSEVKYIDGFGARNRSSNKPVTKDTVFGIGSCTKSITAIAILQLAEDNIISLSDPISTYISYLDSVEGDEISIHELLCHATGMPSDGYLSGLLTQLTGRGEDSPTPPVASRKDLRNHISQFSNERVTDGKWNFYYNTGFTILGELIEACSEYSYSEYIEKNILEPLDMSRSCFRQTEFESRSNRITPYRLEDGDLIPDKLAFDDLLYAAGGLCSSPSEMAIYLQMLINKGAVSDNQVLPKPSIEKMTKGRTEWSENIDGTTQKYGYGVFVQPFLDDTLISHGGMMETTTAWFGYLEESDRGIFLASNTTPSRPLKTLGKTLLASIQDQDPNTVVPRRKLECKLDPLTGTYETPRGAMTATVRRLNGGIKIEADNPGWSRTHVFMPESLDPDTHNFRAVSDDGTIETVEFVTEDDNVTLRIGRWQLHRRSSTE